MITVGGAIEKKLKKMNKTAKELFEEIGKLEEAFETIYEVMDNHTVSITYKYSDSIKQIYVTYHFTQGFEIKGRFWLESIDLIKQGIHKIEEELGWDNE